MKPPSRSLGACLLIACLCITGCQSTPQKPPSGATAEASPTLPPTQSLATLPSATEKPISPAAHKILSIGQEMALVKREIIQGSCWDYANAVYNQAGYPNRNGQRITIFKGKKSGPYAAIALIEPGDFLYYINHSNYDVEHSAIFIEWIDIKRNKALMLSYGGEHRKAPARYRLYDLSSVYRIIRAN
jgi:hypothetical protein